MKTGGELARQRFVDLSMAPDEREPFERLRDDDDAEVGLRAGLHAVLMALVLDGDDLRREGGAEQRLDSFLATHARRIPTTSRGRSRFGDCSCETTT